MLECEEPSENLYYFKGKLNMHSQEYPLDIS